jgi:hypothetical protein
MLYCGTKFDLNPSNSFRDEICEQIRLDLFVMQKFGAICELNDWKGKKTSNDLDLV